MKIKIICLNVWIGGILFDEMVDFLKKENADILLLQEVFNGDLGFKQRQHRTFGELKKILGFKHGEFAPTFTEEVEERELTQGNAILSKFPITQEAISFFDVPFGKRDPLTNFHLTPRSLQHVVARVGEKQLHLLNIQGIWGTHGNDTDRRLNMADQIVREVNGYKPLVLAGDFNVNEDTQSIEKIEQRLTNVFKNTLVTSFNIKRKNLSTDPGFASSVVDMMFVSRDIEVLSKSVPNIDISDHLPLICEIEL